MQKQITAIALSAFLFFGGIGGLDFETNSVSCAATKSKVVYIAPHSGTKYHTEKKCRGLRKAKSIKTISIKNAKKQGYSACKLCP